MPTETVFLKRGRQEAVVLGQLGPSAALCCPVCHSAAVAFDLADACCVEADEREEQLRVPLKCGRGHRFELVLHSRGGDDGGLHLLVAVADA